VFKAEKFNFREDKAGMGWKWNNVNTECCGCRGLSKQRAEIAKGETVHLLS
jgi:hypothetical protein